MKKTTYFLSAMLMVACFTRPASAQFEGKINYVSYEYSENGTEEKKDEFSLYITPDRILLQGENKYDFMGSIKTEGVLVRMDFQDFVFLTGDDQALRISKADIISMMTMFGSEEDKEELVSEGESIDYKRTGETKKIQGYLCEKFAFQNEDDENEQTIIWMTKEIDVNWGMLAEPWGGSADSMIESFPMDIVFKEKYFPIQVEGYKDGQLKGKLEATEINNSPVARAMVQIPSGVEVLGLWEFMSRYKPEGN